MKTIPNSPVFKAWLARKPEFAALAKREAFTFEDDLFEKAAHIVAAHHPSMNQASVEIRAALQLLMGGHFGEVDESDEQEIIVDSLEIRLPSWVRKWAIAVLILLGVIAFAAIAKAEPGNAIPQSQVLASFHSNPGVLAQFGGIVIQLQNGGSTLATRGGGLVIFNCTGAGLSCSFSGSTFTMNGSGGSGSGCVPPGTVPDALLYDSGSGTCPDVTKWTTNGTTTITAAATAIFDLSAAATFKVPTSAGCAPTVNAVACYDSANYIWTFGSNGSTVDLCPTTGGTPGQVFESTGSGCGGYADPIVSGPDAPGAAPTKNPVQVGFFDGTDVQRASSDTSGRLNVNINGTVPVSGTFWQSTQPVSGTFWPYSLGQQVASSSVPVILPSATITTLTPPSAAAIASAIVSNPPTVPVTGTFWQTTQPVSGTFWQTTQPVSGTVTANAGTGSFTVAQATGSNLHMVCDSGCSSSAGFADNSAFTVGTTAINPIGGLYDTGADPLISNGNAGRARIDSHSYLMVDGSAVTQPVSGTFWQTTQPVSAASLPLPSGAATSANQCGAATSSPCMIGGNAGGTLTGQPMCPNTYVNNGLSTSGSTQAVALSSGKSIYICDFFVNSASTAAVSVKLVYGTGTNCATSPSDLSLLVPMQAPSSIAPAGQNVTPPSNTLWSTPASQAVCVNLSSANAVNVMFHWTQF